MTATAEVKERPIIFSAPMILAILRGSKTQTRRVIKPQPPDDWSPTVGLYHPTIVDRHGEEQPGPEVFGAADGEAGRKCPQWAPGSRLWVRETWRLGAHYAIYTAKDIREAAEFGTHPMDDHIHYRAHESPKDHKWRSPYHMPRWASRITLEITDVRAQRVQEISEADAIAEGCESQGGLVSAPMEPEEYDGYPARYEFHGLWDLLNAHRGYSWESNPWIWALTFKRLEDDDA